MQKPKGAQYEIDGLFYKIGVHDKIFFWASDRWQSSTRAKEEIQRANKKQNKVGI